MKIRQRLMVGLFVGRSTTTCVTFA